MQKRMTWVKCSKILVLLEWRVKIPINIKNGKIANKIVESIMDNFLEH